MDAFTFRWQFRLSWIRMESVVVEPPVRKEYSITPLKNRSVLHCAPCYYILTRLAIGTAWTKRQYSTCQDQAALLYCCIGVNYLRITIDFSGGYTVHEKLWKHEIWWSTEQRFRSWWYAWESQLLYNSIQAIFNEATTAKVGSNCPILSRTASQCVQMKDEHRRLFHVHGLAGAGWSPKLCLRGTVVRHPILWEAQVLDNLTRIIRWYRVYKWSWILLRQ
jgi:hypothetical protein